jgi:septum formation topological specificity factor MinE
MKQQNCKEEENKYGEFIRDITSVVPMSKSEAKRRLDEILAQQRKEIELKLSKAICDKPETIKNVKGELFVKYIDVQNIITKLNEK